MVQTITPVVHGERRAWRRAATLHAVGATLSASALGAVLGSIGAATGAPWGRGAFLAVGVVALLYATRELLGLPIPLPNLRRQVPEWWRTFFSPSAAAVLYGLGLGVGFLTYLSFGTLAAVAAAAVASGSPVGGAAVMAPFGAARALSILVARRAETSEGVSRTIERLDALAMSGLPKLVNGVALLGIAATAAVASTDAGRSRPSSAAAWALAAVFAWAGLAKILQPGPWRAAVDGYGLGPITSIAAAAVPVAELSVAILVAAGLPRVAGALGVGLTAAFSLAILRARRLAGDRVPCGCFGRTRSRDFRVLLLRNAAIAAVAVVSILQPSAGRLRFHVPAGPELLPAALAAAGAAVAFLLVRASTRIRARYRA